MYKILVLLLFSSMAASASNLQYLETQYGGRLGVFAIGKDQQVAAANRSTEKFPMCSTFKIILAGAVLNKTKTDPWFLQKKIHYNAKQLVSYSPITEKFVSEGMTVEALAQATVTTSDNTAANLLIEALGGIKEVNRFARNLGDKKFNLTRLEPNLGPAHLGDNRDTTTPKAMTLSIYELIFGEHLSIKNKQKLVSWLKASQTGKNRIRAGLADEYKVGDKTGTCGFGSTNDVAIVWDKRGNPMVLSIFYTQASNQAAANELVLAKAAGLIFAD